MDSRVPLALQAAQDPGAGPPRAIPGRRDPPRVGQSRGRDPRARAPPMSLMACLTSDRASWPTVSFLYLHQEASRGMLRLSQVALRASRANSHESRADTVDRRRRVLVGRRFAHSALFIWLRSTANLDTHELAVHSWTRTKLLRRKTSISYWHQPVRMSKWLSPTFSVFGGISSAILRASSLVNLRKSICASSRLLR